jgi:hypothetical protein
VLYSSLRHGGTLAWHRLGRSARDDAISGDGVVKGYGSQHVRCASLWKDGDVEFVMEETRWSDFYR